MSDRGADRPAWGRDDEDDISSRLAGASISDRQGSGRRQRGAGRGRGAWRERPDNTGEAPVTPPPGLSAAPGQASGWDFDVEKPESASPPESAGKTERARDAARGRPLHSTGPRRDDHAAVAAGPVLSDDISAAGHVLEVYDLTKEVKTEDVDLFATRLRPSASVPAPYVVRVDDAHALAVFGSPDDATEALARAASGAEASPNPPRGRGSTRAAAAARPPATFSVRAVADSTHAATLRTPASRVAPARRRPQTNTAVARRLIGGALGININKEIRRMAENSEDADVARRGQRMAAETQRFDDLQRQRAKGQKQGDASAGKAEPGGGAGGRVPRGRGRAAPSAWDDG
ncbi:unnamed protein product [Pedinophyceae sp. YPF-701]|nr:unnamed protein product [Pedinophyceae sp. YPF-701]